MTDTAFPGYNYCPQCGGYLTTGEKRRQAQKCGRCLIEDAQARTVAAITESITKGACHDQTCRTTHRRPAKKHAAATFACNLGTSRELFPHNICQSWRKLNGNFFQNFLLRFKERESAVGTRFSSLA